MAALTAAQRREVRRAVQRAERAAADAMQAHHDLCAAFGQYSTADGGMKTDSARRADAAVRHAQDLRSAAEGLDIEVPGTLEAAMRRVRAA